MKCSTSSLRVLHLYTNHPLRSSLTLIPVMSDFPNRSYKTFLTMLILKPVELAISSSVASSDFKRDLATLRYSSPPIIDAILTKGSSYWSTNTPLPFILILIPCLLYNDIFTLFSGNNLSLCILIFCKKLTSFLDSVQQNC